MLTLRKGGLRTCGLFIFLFFFSFLLRSPKWKEPHRLRRQRGQQQAQVSLPSSVNIWSILFLAALRIACFFIFIYLSRLLFSFDTPSAENFNPFYFSFHVDQFALPHLATHVASTRMLVFHSKERNPRIDLSGLVAACTTWSLFLFSRLVYTIDRKITNWFTTIRLLVGFYPTEMEIKNKYTYNRPFQ